MNSANLHVHHNKTACFIRAHFAGHQLRVTAIVSVYGDQADCKCQKEYMVLHINEGKHTKCTVHVCFIFHICHTTLSAHREISLQICLRVTSSLHVCTHANLLQTRHIIL